ncbi:hypothetical protein F2P79_010624 [Pimephales promelas]|nr:hypothetical protein F2P79_010624 [Pimephales promelas]
MLSVLLNSAQELRLDSRRVTPSRNSCVMRHWRLWAYLHQASDEQWQSCMCKLVFTGYTDFKTTLWGQPIKM